MGEMAKSIGEKLESFSGGVLLPNFGWQQLLNDLEIKCSRSSHKNSKFKNKKTHGIDLLCKYFDPYINSHSAVIIECKNRQMNSITAHSVNEWLSELINNIECAQSAPELKASNVDAYILSTGLLIIHANDDKYDEQQIDKILRGISVQSRRNPINIFIASNREINMWSSLFLAIKNDFTHDGFDYLYPSIDGYSKILSKHVTINSLFSKFIFAHHKCEVDYKDDKVKGKKEEMSSVLFSFDDVSADSFRYLWSMFKAFQMEGSDYYIFYFYPRKTEDVQMLTSENFLGAIEQNGKITESTKKKINVKILDNRSLSPVYTIKG